MSAGPVISVCHHRRRPLPRRWALLLGFGFYARRRAAPAVDLSLFRIRSFRVGTLAGGLCRIGMNGVPYLLPLMLQVGFGLSPIASGSHHLCRFGGRGIGPYTDCSGAAPPWLSPGAGGQRGGRVRRPGGFRAADARRRRIG